MSNRTLSKERLEIRLEDLTNRHKTLDTQLKESYNNGMNNDEIHRAKALKLLIKNEMVNIVKQLENYEA